MTLTRSKVKVKVTGLLNFRQLAKPCMLVAMTAAPLRGFLVGPYLFWPNGWMDQDVTWWGGRRLSQSNIVLDGDPAPPPQKGADPPPIFGPCLLWPNGWMDQNATW